jgi:hypothetical protein
LARLAELQAVRRNGAIGRRHKHGPCGGRVCRWPRAGQQSDYRAHQQHNRHNGHADAGVAQHGLLPLRLVGREPAPGLVLDLFEHTVEPVGNVVLHQRHRAAVLAGVLVQTGALERVAAAFAALERLEVDGHDAFSMLFFLCSKAASHAASPSRRMQCVRKDR